MGARASLQRPAFSPGPQLARAHGFLSKLLLSDRSHTVALQLPCPWSSFPLRPRCRCVRPHSLPLAIQFPTNYVTPPTDVFYLSLITANEPTTSHPLTPDSRPPAP
jgi:hypothetical protein